MWKEIDASFMSEESIHEILMKVLLCTSIHLHFVQSVSDNYNNYLRSIHMLLHVSLLSFCVDGLHQCVCACVCVCVCVRVLRVCLL